ncbi:hypothetical protein T4B_2541 [Trichinella pseudospiralis]|uniref:Uncharacterized protein n=1 Tax=Trichinella pseudospiralis TaxID=6337 RepID=A0A0V1GLR1_TRIPS|nr:hypothetical protein T4B_2541 [Trichinella pseudospiralis]
MDLLVLQKMAKNLFSKYFEKYATREIRSSFVVFLKLFRID